MTTAALPTKVAKSLKKGDMIVVFGEAPANAPKGWEFFGLVDFVYKCHGKVHVLIHMNGKQECRSFSKDDLITLAS